MERVILGTSSNGSFLILGVIFVWLAILTTWLVLFARRYEKLVKMAAGEDWDKLLKKIVDIQQNNAQEIKKNKELFSLLQKQAKFHIQKVGLIRYNPFNQTGGNQSFSLALLNGKGEGLVISSFHRREVTRVYTKEVIKKMDNKSFSIEEKEAIKKALH